MESGELPANPRHKKRTYGTRLKRRLIVLAIIYVVGLTIGWSVGLTDRLILFPTTNHIGTLAESRLIDTPVGAQEVFVTRLMSTTQPTFQPTAFVLEFTGNATRAEHVAEGTAWSWQKHPVEVWAVNFPGYGKSAGPAGLKSIATAALAEYDALAREANGRPIFLVGTSLGTTAALHVAANRPVAGLVLLNPPALRQLIVGEHGWWNLWLAAYPISLGVPRELDSVANAGRVGVAGVFITSGKDEVVPLKYQQRVATAFAGPKRVLLRESRGHNDPFEGSDDVWMMEQINWLWDQAGLAK